MGYDRNPAAAPVWEAWRDEFPITQELVYLHHAGVAPLCRPAAEAMSHLADDALRFGSLHSTSGWPPTKGSARPPPASSALTATRSPPSRTPPRDSPP